MKETIPVFFASDDGYAPYLAVAITSLIDNANKDYDYKLYVLYDDLSEWNQTRLKKLEQPGFEIIFDPMKERMALMQEKKSNKLRCDYFTMTIYFRLFIPDMFPQYNKGIYIDSDIVVPGDISKLYNEDLKGNPIGGCIDFSIQEVPPLTQYVDGVVGVDHTHYINSGVLLMDMAALRKVKFAEYFVELMNTYHFDSIAPDQDYINAMLNGHIHFLNNTWDVFPEEGKPELADPQLIHYNLFAKPWCYSGLPYESYFWKYAEKTDFYLQIKTHLASYSAEQKAHDTQSMQEMAARGLDLVANGVRFKDVLNSFEGDKTGWLHQIDQL